MTKNSSAFMNYEIDSQLTISIKAWIGVIAAIVALIILIGLLQHFNKQIVPYSLKTLSIIIMIISLIINLQYIIFNNNALLQSIHSKYKFIDKYCDILYQIQVAQCLILKFFIWMFFLFRLRSFFKSTPFHLSNVSFYCFMLTVITTSVPVIYQFVMHGQETIFVAADNDQYRACWMSQSSLELNVIMIGLMAINDWIINILLLYLLYSKRKQLEIYQIENDELSIHFSQRDNNSNVDTKIMKKCILSGLITLIVESVGVTLFVLYDNDIALRISLITMYLPIISSFDMESCNLTNNNNNDNEEMNAEESENINIKREQYLQRMMEAYYSTPKRIKKGERKIQIRI